MELISFNNAGLRLLVTFLLCYVASCAERHVRKPKVTIPQGTLEGVTLTTKNNRSIYGFRGIPYARPPIGDLRFKAPVAADPWDDTFDAGSDGSACIQSPYGVIIGSEDCLYINVYTPQLPSNDSTPLPVMVHIYGGKFAWGSNNHTAYNPTYLLDKDILLAVPNFRSGALGFLSTGDQVAPGNWALKDQILALKWVQNNIKYFGGDPHRVTLVGSSSGSAMVQLLSLTDLTEGLYHRYVSQSGHAISTMVFQVNPVEVAFQLGEYLGCKQANTSTLLINCLKNRTATEIMHADSMFFNWEVFPMIRWAPVVEPKIQGAVLTDTPRNLLTNGTTRDIPAIVGWCRDEGFVITAYFYANPTKFEEFLNDFDNLLPYVLNYHRISGNVSAVTSALKSYYFNDDLTTNRTELLATLTMMAGDYLSIAPSYQVLQHDSPSSEPWYLYSFNYRGTFSYGYSFTGGLSFENIVAHADELAYLFDMENSDFFRSLNETMSDTDLKMVDEMVELWTSFVTSGVPYSAALGTASWPRYSTSKQYLRIGSGSDISLEVETSNLKDKMEFWTNLTGTIVYQ